MSEERESSAHIGLCETCVHARIVPTPRAKYWRCALAASDPRFEKYPRLPVLECEGYSQGEPEPGERPG